MQAARVAKKLTEELGMEVDIKDGPFGSAKVIFNGETVARTGITGWLPRTSVIIKRIKSKLGEASA